MQKKNVEIWVGVFVAAGIAALVMLAMKVSNLAAFTNRDGYDVIAHFENIGGLKERAAVTVAGVRIGRVKSIVFDDKTYEAVVTMRIDTAQNRLPLDTSASILTAGLLGEQYVSLEPGGDENFLKQGDQIKLTQSAIILEKMVGQFLFSKAAGEDKAGGGHSNEGTAP